METSQLQIIKFVPTILAIQSVFGDPFAITNCIFTMFSMKYSIVSTSQGWVCWFLWKIEFEIMRICLVVYFVNSDISKDFLKKKNKAPSSSWTFVILCFHNLKILSSRQLTSIYLRDTHFKNQIQSFNLILFCNPKEKSHWVVLWKLCQ